MGTNPPPPPRAGIAALRRSGGGRAGGSPGGQLRPCPPPFLGVCEDVQGKRSAGTAPSPPPSPHPRCLRLSPPPPPRGGGAPAAEPSLSPTGHRQHGCPLSAPLPALAGAAAPPPHLPSGTRDPGFSPRDPPAPCVGRASRFASFPLLLFLFFIDLVIQSLYSDP